VTYELHGRDHMRGVQKTFPKTLHVVAPASKK
jgi:hypothetical protein